MYYFDVFISGIYYYDLTRTKRCTTFIYFPFNVLSAFQVMIVIIADYINGEEVEECTH
jgi:hypothetical protein